MRIRLSMSVALMTLASTISAASAQAPPSADTFVSSNAPAKNFGSQPLLAVQSGTSSYIRFNLSGLPAGATVSRATVRLFVDAVSQAGSFDVYEIDQPWTENSLNFNTAPSLGVSASGGKPVTVSKSSLNQFVAGGYHSTGAGLAQRHGAQQWPRDRPRRGQCRQFRFRQQGIGIYEP